MVRCANWYHLYNLKNVKNTHGGVLLLVKLHADACMLKPLCTNSTKSPKASHMVTDYWLLLHFGNCWGNTVKH